MATSERIQIHVPCAGHFDNGPHFLCMEDGAMEAVRLVEAVAMGESLPGARSQARSRVSVRAR